MSIKKTLKKHTIWFPNMQTQKETKNFLNHPSYRRIHATKENRIPTRRRTRTMYCDRGQSTLSILHTRRIRRKNRNDTHIRSSSGKNKKHKRIRTRRQKSRVQSTADKQRKRTHRPKLKKSKHDTKKKQAKRDKTTTTIRKNNRIRGKTTRRKHANAVQQTSRKTHANTWNNIRG